MTCSWVKSGETKTGPVISICYGWWQRHRKAKMCSNDKHVHLCKPPTVRFLRPTQSLTHSNLGASWDNTCWQEAKVGRSVTVPKTGKNIWQMIPPRTINSINKLAIIRSLVTEVHWVPTPKSSPRYMDHRPPWRLWCFDTFWPWPCLPWFTSHPVAKKQVYRHTTCRFVDGLQVPLRFHAASNLRKGLHRSPGRMFASHAHGSGCLIVAWWYIMETKIRMNTTIMVCCSVPGGVSMQLKIIWRQNAHSTSLLC